MGKIKDKIYDKLRYRLKQKNRKINKHKINKTDILIIVTIFVITLILAIVVVLAVSYFSKKEEEIVIEKQRINITVPDNYYCILTDRNLPDASDEDWIKEENNICRFEYDIDGINHLFVKDENDKIDPLGNTSKLDIINLNTKETIYLAIGETYQINLIYDSYGDENNSIIYKSDNPQAVSVDNNGFVSAVGDGDVWVRAFNGDNEFKIRIVSTSLIVKTPDCYDFEKEYIGCEQYTKAQNDLVDEILKDRINDAGYGTRAGVVEAMRFLTLNLPYKITYMYENGRLAYGIDGEGRYYHKGLYLSASKYESIDKPGYGPGTWGCPIYQFEFESEKENGLDCSGLVTWAILNGGYDIGDIGAGGSGNGAFALWDVGDRQKNSLELFDDIKAGDLVHSEEAGGHIGMVVGIKDNHIYVAQALWHKTIGCVITTYTKEEFVDYWNLVMLMDDYYKKDGNYTNMWH